MRILVIHDSQGKIESLAVPGPELAGQISMRPQKGKLVTEVEVPDISGDVLDAKVHQRLLNIIESYRVEMGPRRGGLVRRSTLQRIAHRQGTRRRGRAKQR